MSHAKKVRVYNDSPWTHKETFKGDPIAIPGNGFIEMEYFEAHEFKGQYFPITKDAGGQQDEKSYKRIRLVPIEGEDAKAELKPTCQACKYEATSKQDLEDHIDATHLEDLEDKEVADKRRKAKKSA